MDIMELGAIGELVGGVAVIATLAYLVIQVKQNTAAIRSATHQTQVDSQVAVNSSIANDRELAALIAKANDDPSTLDASDEIRLQYLYINFFNLWHSGFWNNRERLLPTNVYGLWDRGMALVFQNQAACTQAWNGVAAMYDDEFRNHVDALRARVGTVPPAAAGTLTSERNEI